MCIALPAGADMNAAPASFARDLRARISPQETGFSIIDLRERGLAASRGSTDFGEYFVYFSFFLIVSAVLLATLFFRLGVEQRVREIGILRALGFPLRTLRAIFLLEGAILSIAGSLVGLLGAVGYGSLMVYGLRTWWVGAVGTQSLFLAISWTDLGLGAAAGILVSLTTIFLTLRGLSVKARPRALLAGVLESSAVRSRRARSLVDRLVCRLLSPPAFCSWPRFSKRSPTSAGFFGAGFLLLISLLGLIAIYLRRTDRRSLSGQGWVPLVRLGARNTAYRPGRSLLCIALIAGATFIIVSTEAFRRDPQDVSLDPASGTGGYPLLASSSLPVLYDPNTRRRTRDPRDSSFRGPRAPTGQVRSVSRAPRGRHQLPEPLRPAGPEGAGRSALLYLGGTVFIPGLPGCHAGGRNGIRGCSSKTKRRTAPFPPSADANTIQYILHLGRRKRGRCAPQRRDTRSAAPGGGP